MGKRIDSGQALDAYKAMLALSIHTARSVDAALRDLVKLRASQLNGCAFCIDMHWKEARKRGESEARLYGLDAWQQSSACSARERAALAWTEAVTRLDHGRVDDAVYAQAQSQFSKDELAELTYLIVAINGWNRLFIAFRIEPGAPLPQL